MRTIAATRFQQRCLALLDDVDPDGIVITKNGRPVARLVPFHPQMGDLIGSMKAKIRIRKDILTTGAIWGRNTSSPTSSRSP